MGPFREKVFCLMVWRAFLATLIAVVLTVTNSFALGAALLIGAHVALVFSLTTFWWAERFDEDRIDRVDAWRMLTPKQRPAGIAGRRWARNCFKETGLRFAKAGSAAATALAAASLVLASE